MDIRDKEFMEFSDYIRINFGINLTEQKKNLLVSRLNSVLLKGNFESFEDYFHYLISDRSGFAVSELVDKITTNHTYFYREKKHFDFFVKEALPFFTENNEERDIRIWSAGCSSGEEPYSIAMALDQYFGNQKLFWDTKILATDLSQDALSKATEGVYKKDNIKNLPVAWQHKYFKKISDDQYRISEVLKKEVIYRRLNLMSRFNFKRKFHIIFCRNVMIYFNDETTHRIVRKFYDALEDGGYLFISHSESLDRRKTKLKYIKPAIYRKE